MPVRPLVTSAPLLGRRRAQCTYARDLLGARHPLVHAVDDMGAMGEQSVVVATMLKAGVSAVSPACRRLAPPPSPPLWWCRSR
jgi:hypothetical protein